MLTRVRERVFSASGMGKKTFRFVGRCFLARWAFRAEESFITSSSVAMVSFVGGRTRFRVVFFSSVRPRLLLLCTIVPFSSGIFPFGRLFPATKGVVSYYFRSICFFFFSRISYVGF